MKISDKSLGFKLMLIMISITLVVIPTLVVFLKGWAKFELTIATFLVLIFLGVFIIALIGEIFELGWLKYQFSSRDQDEAFAKKLNSRFTPLIRLLWAVAIVWGAFIIYELWNKSNGI